MIYEITCEGKVIAKFVDKGDAEICRDALAEYYSDAEFEVRPID